jgi:hypothetical protein
LWGEPISEHRARMALEGVFGQLDHGWLILVDLRLDGPADATDADYVLLHPDCGIALIDVILSRTGDPAGHLREFLENEGFFEQFPGTLPIVRLVLKPTETVSFRRRLDTAFTEDAPIAIANPDWVAAINDLLVPTATHAPHGGLTGASGDVLPARWPDQVAGAIPLKRPHKSRQPQASTKPPQHTAAKQAVGTLAYMREIAPVDGPQDEDLARHGGGFPRAPESFPARRTGEEAVEPAAPSRQPAENAIERRPLLPPAIAPAIRDMARWRNRVMGETRFAAGSPYRVMSDAAIAAAGRASGREIPSTRLSEASGRWQVRAAAAGLLAVMLGGGAVFLAGTTPGDMPGKQISPRKIDATASADPATGADPEAAAETSTAAAAPVQSEEPRTIPKPSVAAFSPQAPVAPSPISAPPPWPRVKPVPPTRATATSSAALSAKPVAGIEKVGIVTGIHDGFGRIVFAWPQAVKYQTQVEDQSLTVKFARPLAADVARIAKELPHYVERATMDGESAVVITLKRPLEIVTMINRNRVAIDLVDRSAATDAVPPVSSPLKSTSENSEPPSVPVTLIEEGGVRSLIFAWPEPVEFTASVAKGEATIRFKRAATIDLQPLATTAPDLVPRISGGKSDVQLLLKLPPGSRLRAYHKGPLVIVDLTEGKRAKPGASSTQSTRTAWAKR